MPGTGPAANATTHFGFKQYTIGGNSNVAIAAINNKGALAGTLTDANGAHGIVIDSNGTTTLAPACGDDPPACPAVPVAMNASGQVVGFSAYGGSVYGFLWQNGAYRGGGAVQLGQGGLNLIGLNNAGTEYYADFLGSGAYNLFVGTPGNFTQVTPPGTGALIRSLNGYGWIAGTTHTPLPTLFAGANGNFAVIAPPGAISADGGYINDLNEVAGTYIDSRGSQHAFLYNGSSYVSFDMPTSARRIAVQALNKMGRVTGVYTDMAAGLLHGFLYNGTAINGFGKFAATATVHVALNDLGVMPVAVTFTDGRSASYRVLCSGDGC